MKKKRSGCLDSHSKTQCDKDSPMAKFKHFNRSVTVDQRDVQYSQVQRKDIQGPYISHKALIGTHEYTTANLLKLK